MPIEIRITDPQKEDPQTLVKTAHFLLKLVGINLLVNKDHPGVAMATTNPLSPIARAGGGVGSGAPEPFITTPPGAVPPTEQKAAVILSNVELDAAGIPWDRRIHSRVKTKTSDGKWRYARGIQDDTIAVVEAELRRTLGAPVPTNNLSKSTELVEEPPREKMQGIGHMRDEQPDPVDMGDDDLIEEELVDPETAAGPGTVRSPMFDADELKQPAPAITPPPVPVAPQAAVV